MRSQSSPSSEVAKLVQAADVFSVAMYGPFSANHPELENSLPPGRELIAAWDFIVPVVGVGVAYHAIALGFGMPASNEYRLSVPKALARWRDDADELFRAFLAATDDIRPRFERQYSIGVGAFAVWGIARMTTGSRPPQQLLGSVAESLGNLLVNEFSYWWTPQDRPQ